MIVDLGNYSDGCDPASDAGIAGEIISWDAESDTLPNQPIEIFDCHKAPSSLRLLPAN